MEQSMKSLPMIGRTSKTRIHTESAFRKADPGDEAAGRNDDMDDTSSSQPENSSTINASFMTHRTPDCVCGTAVSPAVQDHGPEMQPSFIHCFTK